MKWGKEHNEKIQKFTLWPKRVTNKYHVKESDIAKIISAILKKPSNQAQMAHNCNRSY
jgi:hypothetical protein